MVIGNGGATYIDCEKEIFNLSTQDELALQLKLKDITTCILNSDKEVKINNFSITYNNNSYFIPSMTLYLCDVVPSEYTYIGIGACLGNGVFPIGVTFAIRTETIQGEQIPILSTFYITNLYTNAEVVDFDSSI